MGYTSADKIANGAALLLGILSKESPIRYSRFYDGSEETFHKLAVALGLKENDEDRGPGIIDLAVFELVQQGVVETRKLEEPLADGEKDYEIKLTEDGRRRNMADLKFWPAE